MPKDEKNNLKTDSQKSSEFEEKVIEVDRVSRTVKGGRRLRFRALVAVGNRKGKIGIGIGKGQEVLVAVGKAVNKAKKNLVDIKIVNDTIAHETKISFGGAKLFLAPARPGTSIIAGSSVRAVVELSGIKNILSKIIGSSNKINNAKATILALQSLKSKEKSEKEPKNETTSTNK
jgi:small subunit ribosomal protein S5